MKYFLSSVVCLLFLNTNIFASEIINCSILPTLSTEDNENITLWLIYRGVIRNSTEKIIDQSHVTFEVDNMKTLNHDKVFNDDIAAYEYMRFETYVYIISHRGLSEYLFGKELEKTNVIFNNIMDGLNKEDIKCSMILSN